MVKTSYGEGTDSAGNRYVAIHIRPHTCRRGCDHGTRSIDRWIVFNPAGERIATYCPSCLPTN